MKVKQTFQFSINTFQAHGAERTTQSPSLKCFVVANNRRKALLNRLSDWFSNDEVIGRLNDVSKKLFDILDLFPHLLD